MTYLAKDYIPVVERVMSPIRSEPALDLYNARYIKAFRNLIPYTRKVISFREAGRLDLVCNEFYDDRPDLIQPLARYNKIVNLIYDVYVGRVIQIPSLPSLEEALESANTRSILDNSLITLR
jgi:hypothetical protein